MTYARLWKLLTGAEAILLLGRQGLSFTSSEEHSSRELIFSPHNEDSLTVAEKSLLPCVTLEPAGTTVIFRTLCISPSSQFCCLKQAFVITLVTALGAVPCESLNTFNCLRIPSAALGRYPYLANSFSSSPALFPWTIKSTR